MSRNTTWQRALRRLPAISAVAFAAVIALAVPASAHVEVEAAGARALDRNVTLTFSAETESDSAGISALEVILPDGIAPADITYGTGPEGWNLAATERGYKVSGPTLAPGTDASYSVTVRQLPYLKTLAFKTLQTYSDGRVDRWIELDPPADAGHGSPAPVLELLPAAPDAKPVSTGPEAGATTPAPDAPQAAGPAEMPKPTAPAGADGGTSGDANPVLIIGFVVAVLALVGGLWWARRPRRVSGN